MSLPSIESFSSRSSFDNDLTSRQSYTEDDSPIYPKKANHVINAWSQSRTSSFDQESSSPNISRTIKDTYEKPSILISLFNEKLVVDTEKNDSIDKKTDEIIDSNQANRLLNTFEKAHKPQNSDFITSFNEDHQGKSLFHEIYVSQDFYSDYSKENTDDSYTKKQQYPENSYSIKENFSQSQYRSINSPKNQHSSYDTLPFSFPQYSSYKRYHSISQKVGEIYNVCFERCCAWTDSFDYSHQQCPSGREANPCQDCRSDIFYYSIATVFATATLGTGVGIIAAICNPSNASHAFAFSYGISGIWATGYSLFCISTRGCCRITRCCCSN